MKRQNGMNRRKFLHMGAMWAAGSSGAGGRALSYGRIVGANDRISLGHVGIGTRGKELDGMTSELKTTKNVEMTAVCDLWTGNLERAVAANQKYYGRAPRAVRHIDELLTLKNLDAVIISTPEHSHSPLLKMVAEAGKD